MMRSQNPVKKENRAKGLGAEPLFWGLLCLCLTGLGLWLEEQVHLATHSSTLLLVNAWTSFVRPVLFFIMFLL